MLFWYSALDPRGLWLLFVIYRGWINHQSHKNVRTVSILWDEMLYTSLQTPTALPGRDFSLGSPFLPWAEHQPELLSWEKSSPKQNSCHLLQEAAVRGKLHELRNSLFHTELALLPLTDSSPSSLIPEGSQSPSQAVTLVQEPGRKTAGKADPHLPTWTSGKWPQNVLSLF